MSPIRTPTAAPAPATAPATAAWRTHDELRPRSHTAARDPRTRSAVWSAWTEPDKLAQWFLPAPTIARIDRLEARPGGALVTSMSDDGAEFQPHMDACFLLAEPEERLVFTNAISSSWRPTDPDPVPLTAEITFAEHPDGTEYTVLLRHGNPTARARHEQLGFVEGWGSATAQLARLAEGAGTR
ncbi:SRPBCC domain-containing protein [Lysobacter korlensis]|uniref:SRPBCC domain-containing protein n=1 Tax=Lysobacter korlensis TaxID=553636 RepID=A0ABV6RWC4_9GAMM